MEFDSLSLVDGRFRLDDRQNAIYEGLKQIGEEIASLYYGGVLILNCDLKIKSYLLGHIAREIDGGIRDILCSRLKQNTYKCQQCGNTIKKFNHIDEICHVLNVEKGDKFAKEWHKIAEKFHKYAHRGKPWEQTRGKDSFDDLWKNYERILYHLVGDYIKLISLVDKLLESPTPTEEILSTLDNLLNNGARRYYFFRELQHLDWFIPLKEKGYFKAKNAPSPQQAETGGYYTIPFWNVLPYLEKVSHQVSKHGNEKYADELLEIIKNVTKHHVDHDKCLDNYHTWRYFIIILCNLPTEKITDDVIDLIPIWLDSKFDNNVQAEIILGNLLPKLLDSNRKTDWEKAEKIVDIVTQIKWIPRYTEKQKEAITEKHKHIFDKPEAQRTDDENFQIALFKLDEKELTTLIDTHWLIKAFKERNIAENIAEKCSENVVLSLAEKLKVIFRERYNISENDKNYDLSYIWYRSLFSDEDIFDAEAILVLIIREILLAQSKINKGKTREIIQKFLSEEFEYPIFKRLVLFIIGSSWEAYKSVFWELLQDDKRAKELFNEQDYEAEVYTILERNSSSMSIDEKELIRDIIETKVPDKDYPVGGDREYYSAYQKQKWYSAVKTDEYFKSLYDRYRAITQKEEEISFKEPLIQVGTGSSPLSREKIITMTNKELTEYLKRFRTVDYWKGPSVEGLGEALKMTATEMPNKFIEDADPFLKTGYVYVYYILLGILNACGKKIIDWGKLLEFIRNYITPENFWQDAYMVNDEDLRAKHLWVVGIICELIKQGCRNNPWAFPENFNHTAQEILFLLTDKLLAEKDNIFNQQTDSEDYLIDAFNSIWGKISEALLNLALRVRRVEEKSSDSWKEIIKDKYNTLLNKGIIESYVWLGCYLSHLFYLDQEWIENAINKADERLWEAFMSGYLSGKKFDNNIYIWLKPHYEKAIGHQFKRRNSSRQVIEHICIGYLCDIVDDHSLFKKLLDKWNTFQIGYIIDYFGKQRNIDAYQKKASKIFEFWKWVWENKYKEKNENELSNEEKKIISNLSKLSLFLPEINEETSRWLIFVARYVHYDYNAPFFIESLNKLKDRGDSYKYVGQIFLEMLHSSTPTFREEHIRSIVEFLYQRGYIKEANDICNKYAEHGCDFLRPLYNQYNTNRG